MNNDHKQSNLTSTSTKKDFSKPKNRIPLSSSGKNDSQPKMPTYPVTRDSYKKDSFTISPLFLIGAFLAALGFGFLIGPSTDPLSTPPYQSWSLIIIGILIAIPGLIQMAMDYLKNKKKD